MKAFFRHFYPKKPSIAAVDIGMNEIKVAQMAMDSGHPVIGTLSRTGSTPDALEKGLDIDNFKDILLQLVIDCNLPGKRVTSCIWGDKVITRHVEMPLMSRKKLKKAVWWEAEKYIPVPVENMIVDFVPLGKTRQGESTTSRQHILLAAVERNIVYRLFNAFDQAGVILARLDLQPLALWQLLQGISMLSPGGNGSLDGNDNIAVVDIGASSTHIVFIENGRIRYSRAIPYGTGNQHHPGGWTDESGEMIKELARSTKFFRAREKQPPVERLFLTGGGSKLDGVAGLLTRELNTPVEKLTINLGGAVIDPVFAMVTGLCLRAVKA